MMFNIKTLERVFLILEEVPRTGVSNNVRTDDSTESRRAH
jgi:hypothetical protein